MEVTTYLEIIEYLKRIIIDTEFEGHVYSVGGAERDLALKREIKDIDIVIDLPNGGIKFSQWLYEKGVLIREPIVYQHYGTAQFVFNEFPQYEIEAVQTRKECYRDIESRNPETAYGTIEEDASRRDFTINAIYRNVSNGSRITFNDNTMHDIEHGIIRTCGDPLTIFTEDPLRILRAVRFSHRLGFKIDEEIYLCMKTCMPRLKIVSRERIRDEFEKIICGPNAYDAWNTLNDRGFLNFYFGQLMNIQSRIDFLSDEIDNLPNDFITRLVVFFNPNAGILTYIALSYLKNLLRLSNVEFNTFKFVFDSVYKFQRTKLTLFDIRHLAYDCGHGKSMTKKPKDIFLTIVKIAKCLDKNNTINEPEHYLYLSDVKKMFDYTLPVNGEEIMVSVGKEEGRWLGSAMGMLRETVIRFPNITKEQCLELCGVMFKNI